MNGHSIRFQSDDELLGDCRVEFVRTSGPGGQKRNKTSSGVRITHAPSNIHAIAGESRSQSENKMRALRRLRLKIAIEIREEISPMFEPPDWFLAIRQPTRITASHRHVHYAAVAGLILDLFKTVRASPADVGAMLGISTTAVIRFLEDEPMLWTAANKIRADWGLPALSHRS